MKCTPWAAEFLKESRKLSLHSCYKHVVNLCAGERILALHLESFPVTPLSLAVPWKEETFAEMSVAAKERGNVEIKEAKLWLGETFWELGAVEIWNPVITRTLKLSEAEILVEELRSFLHKNGKTRGGFSDAAFLWERQPEDTWLTALLREQAEQIGKSSLIDMEALVTAASSMVGQGTGLTPSGDDFLTGMLLAFSLWSDFPKKKWTLLADMLRQRRKETNDISGQFLMSAGRHEFGAKYHRLMAAVPDRREIEEGLKDIMETGHSSGIDTLNGLAAGLCLICKEYGRKK